MKQFSKSILYLTQTKFNKYIVLKHKLGYSVLDYFTDINAAKHFIDLAIQYKTKNKKITYETYP